MTSLTWWRVEGRLWPASSSGTVLRCKLNFLCNTDSQWLEGHTLRWQDASPCRCSENIGAARYGSCWTACCSPCSFQTARSLVLTRESPRSPHTEAFLAETKQHRFKSSTERSSFLLMLMRTINSSYGNPNNGLCLCLRFTLTFLLTSIVF